MKKIFAKLKSIGDAKPCMKTKINPTTEIYGAATDKKPAFSFDMGGKINIGFWQICIIAAGVVTLAVVSAVATSLKYKKKYKKKLEKIKAKYEKKEAKLLEKTAEAAIEE